MGRDTNKNHIWWDKVFNVLDNLSYVDKVDVKRCKNTLVIIKEDDFYVDDGRYIDTDSDNIIHSLLEEYKEED